MMTRSLHYISIEVRDFPTYDGLCEVDAFLNRFERGMPEQQCFKALKWVLRATSMRWWGMHQGIFED